MFCLTASFQRTHILTYVMNPPQKRNRRESKKKKGISRKHKTSGEKTNDAAPNNNKCDTLK